MEKEKIEKVLIAIKQNILNPLYRGILKDTSKNKEEIIAKIDLLQQHVIKQQEMLRIQKEQITLLETKIEAINNNQNKALENQEIWINSIQNITWDDEQDRRIIVNNTLEDKIKDNKNFIQTKIINKIQAKFSSIDDKISTLDQRIAEMHKQLISHRKIIFIILFLLVLNIILLGFLVYCQIQQMVP